MRIDVEILCLIAIIPPVASCRIDMLFNPVFDRLISLPSLFIPSDNTDLQHFSYHVRNFPTSFIIIINFPHGNFPIIYIRYLDMDRKYYRNCS